MTFPPQIVSSDTNTLCHICQCVKMIDSVSIISKCWHQLEEKKNLHMSCLLAMENSILLHYAKPHLVLIFLFFLFISPGLMQIVDACQPIEDVEKQLQEIALACVKQCQQGKPLSSLWSTQTCTIERDDMYEQICHINYVHRTSFMNNSG